MDCRLTLPLPLLCSSTLSPWRRPRPLPPKRRVPRPLPRWALSRSGASAGRWSRLVTQFSALRGGARPGDVRGAVGPGRDCGLPAGGEVCASAEGGRRPWPLSQLLPRCSVINSPAAPTAPSAAVIGLISKGPNFVSCPAKPTQKDSDDEEEKKKKKKGKVAPKEESGTGEFRAR